MLITVVIGLSPLRSMGKHSLAQDLREGAIEARGGASGRTLQAIVAVQIAVTVTLLVGAALFGRSFAALAKFDPGFEPAGVLSMRVQLPIDRGPAPVAPLRSLRAGPASVDAGAPSLALLEDLRGLPGVTQAALASRFPSAARARSSIRPRAWARSTRPIVRARICIACRRGMSRRSACA